MTTITLNGEVRSFDPPISTVAALLRLLELEGRPVVVERNGEALFPREFGQTALEDGDRIEIVRVVAGG